MGRTLGDRAVVIGASMAGMMSARVLSRYFERVTIVERDRFPEGTAARQGVPQGHHAHVLLVRGRQILESLFPGIIDRVIAKGGRLMDMAGDAHWVTPAGPGIRFHSGLEILACSRRLLETTVREQLSRDSRITIVEGREMAGLVTDSAGLGVDGVVIRRARTGASREELIAADFVVDAGGRGSKMPSWLVAAGYAPPRDSVVTAHLGYASRLYRMREDAHRDWSVLFVQAAPPEHPRFGLVMPIEDGQWLVSLGGGDGEHPPDDDAGFVAFARTLRDPGVYEAIRDAEPLSPIAITRATQNRIRHFERLSRWPQRLAVLGDAACAFNPVYGQGMTVAALGATTLEQCLRESPGYGGLDSVGRRFQRALARVNATPWMLATGEDCRYRRTEGLSPRIGTRLMHRYMDRVVALTTHDAAVRETLLSSFNMVAPLTATFRPGIAWRVLTSALTAKRPLDRQDEAGRPATVAPLGWLESGGTSDTVRR
jgi:2-polyprenyl-6-methoxyphenol hydroxylase-like FAD-dependent oxidoreductase